MSDLLLRIRADVDDAVKGMRDIQAQSKQTNDQLASDFKKSAESSTAAARKTREVVTSQTKIMGEAFTTVSSEVIESWGVDGDIANELAKMLQKLPLSAKLSLGAIAGLFAAGAVSVGVLAAAISKTIDVAEKLGTDSQQNFQKFRDGLKDAGFEVTELDRKLAGDLTKSVNSITNSVDGLFSLILKESGPALKILLDDSAKLLGSNRDFATAFGDALSKTLIGGIALLKTFKEQYQSFGGGITGAIGAAASFEGAEFDKRFEKNILEGFVRAKLAAENAKGATFKPSSKGSAAQLSELQQLEKQIAKVTTETERLQGLNSREFVAAQRLASVQAYKRELEELNALQGKLGISSKALGIADERARAGTGRPFQRLLDREQFQQALADLKAIDAATVTTEQRAKLALDDLNSRFTENITLQIKGLDSQLNALDDQTKAFIRATQLADDARFELDKQQLSTARLALQNNVARRQDGRGPTSQDADNQAFIEASAAAAEIEAKKGRIQELIALETQEVAGQTEANTKKLELRRQYNDALVALEDELTERLNQIELNRQANSAAANSSSNRSIFGVNDESLTALQAMRASVGQAFRQMGQDAQGFRQIVGGALQAVAGATQQTLAAFILTGKGGGAAFKQLAADAIAALAVQSGIKAIFELAEGFAANARYDFVSGAQHFAAAKTYGVVAAIAGGAGVAIGAAGGLGGASGATGGALGNQLSGTNAQGQPTENRFRYVDANANPAAPNNIIITLKTDQEQRVSNVEQALAVSYRNGGTARSIIQAETSGIPLTSS